MRLRNALLIFLVLFLASCATFKPLQTKQVSINGIFKANYRNDTYNGFFSWSNGNLRMDVVNSFGFSVYGIYVQNGDVFVKDYQTGKVYRNLKAGSLDLNVLRDTIVKLTMNFTKLCNKRMPNVVVLRCGQVGHFKVPDDMILRTKGVRLRVRLKNLKLAGEKR